MKAPREVDPAKPDNSKAKGKRVKNFEAGAAAFAEEREFLVNLLRESHP